MKKIFIAILSVCLLLTLASPHLVFATDQKFSGDLDGGVNVSHTPGNDGLTWYRIMPQSQDFSGTGLSIRIKNNILDGGGSPLHIAINELDSDRVITSYNGGANKFETINLDGTKVSHSFRDFDSAVILPAGFDGYLHLPYSSFVVQNDFGTGNNSFNYAQVFAIYVGINLKYDNFSNYVVGDIEVLNETSRLVLDVSELTDLTLGNHFIKDWGDLDNLHFTKLAPAPKPTGDLTGSVNISHTPGSDGITWYRIMPESQDLSGTGLYIRIKNNILDGGGSPLHIAINELDSDRVIPTYNGGANKFETINLDGTKVSHSFRDFDSAVILPAGFDGYLHLPYSSFVVQNDFGTGNKSFNYAQVFAIYVGINLKYDNFSNYVIGDIETVSSTGFKMVLDSSKLTSLNYLNHFVKDWGDLDNLHFTLFAAETEQPKVTIDYTTVNLTTPHDIGANVSINKSEADDNTVFKLQPQTTDFKQAHSIAIRLINNTNITTPVTISIHETSAEIFKVDKTTEEFVYFKSLDNQVTVNQWRGWDSAVVIPGSFDGYMILPVSIFIPIAVVNDGKLDIANVYAMFFQINSFYDFFANLTFSDVYSIKEDTTVETIVDASTLNKAGFNSVYAKDYNGKYLNVRMLSKGKRIGDVKYLETFDFIKDDAELQKEFPVWTGGSTVVNTLVDGGMKVDIGGVVPGNNIYGSIDIFPKYYTSDWTNWTDDLNNNAPSKGVTFYLKNLSPREISINLEFEEMTVVDGQNVFERWNIKYGAMILFYDINTGDEFYRLAKPVLDIPVGFEGYVRIDFSQYWVPQWCEVGDFELNVTEKMTGFFLTTNTTENEGLSYIIDNIGIYFNDTVASTMFEESPNGVRANMQLDEGE